MPSKRRKRTLVPRAVVQVSDLHCGALVGLTPPKYEDQSKVGYRVRRWIWQEWLGFCARVRTIGPYVLVINGDMFEGTWSKFELLTKSSSKQFRMAREALTPLVRDAVGTYFVGGTGVHDQDDAPELADEFAELCADLRVVPTADGLPCHDRAEFVVNGLRHAARHHTSVPGRTWTQASAAGIHLANDRADALAKGHTPADVLLVAHRHTFTAAHVQGAMCVAAPAWKGIDRHTRKVTHTDIPTVGGVILDYRQCEKGEFPHVRDHLRSPAQDPALTFDHADGR